jgi:hypothetical protein
MLMELGRVEEAIPVFDQVIAGQSLPAVSFRESAALNIAQHYITADQFDRALHYIKIVEDIDSRSDGNRDAHILHAVAICCTQGRTMAIDYLEHLRTDPRTPAEWEKLYRETEEQIRALRDPE